MNPRLAIAIAILVVTALPGCGDTAPTASPPGPATPPAVPAATPAGPARTSPIGALLDKADTAAGANDHAAAIAALHDALDIVSKDAPLTVEPFLVVERPAKSYGDYEQRADTPFAAGAELLFYMEPKNLVYARDASGTYLPGFEVDLEVLDAAGASVAKQENFGSFRLPSKSRVQDIFLNLNVELTGAPPGDYTVRFVIRDLNSTKKATVEKKITIA